MALSKFLDPKNDVAFRKIFGSEEHKDILINFINDILELEGNNQIEQIEFLSPIQDPEIASKKQSIVDVLCKDKNGVQIIVEMQVAPTKGFEKRAIYYASKAYSRQLNKGTGEDGKYKNLKQVIFIAISDCIIFKDKKNYKSDHIILDKETYEHDLKDFSFTFIELPKFKKDKIEQLETILEKWCYFFKHADATTEEDMAKIASSYQTIGKAYEVVNQYNWDEKQLIAYEQEQKRIWDNIAAIDYQKELIQKVQKERESIQKEKKQIAQDSRNKRNIEIALSMLSEKLDIDIISKVTGLTKTEILDLEKTSKNN